MPHDAQRWWINMLDSIRGLRDCQRYHCRPSELDDEDWHVVARHRAIETAEQQYADAERKTKARKR